MRKVTIIREANVLVLENSNSGLSLLRTGSVILPGYKLTVGEEEMLYFDNGNLMALPFELKGKKFYILARDVGENLNDPLTLP